MDRRQAEALASAMQTLASEADIETETLQRFFVRNAGVVDGRLT